VEEQALEGIALSLKPSVADCAEAEWQAALNP
jgi:hypothetical protein